MSSVDDSKKVQNFIKMWGGFITFFLVGGICGYLLRSFLG